MVVYCFGLFLLLAYLICYSEVRLRTGLLGCVIVRLYELLFYWIVVCLVITLGLRILLCRFAL